MTRFRFALLAAPLLPSSPVTAETVYSYTGNFYNAANISDSAVIPKSYNATMRITGMFTVANPLINVQGIKGPADISAEVLDFSFDDRRVTTSGSSLCSRCFIAVDTDATGAITAFNVLLENPDPFSVTETNYGLELGGKVGDLDAVSLFNCSAVDDKNNCTESAIDASGSVRSGEWTMTTTPLPTALPLLATGLAGLGLLSWRRKRKAQLN